MQSITHNKNEWLHQGELIMKNSIRYPATLLIAPVASAMLVTQAPAQQGEPIKIGTSLPLTGPRSVNGEKHRKGFVLCVEMINERGVACSTGRWSSS